jgi:NAD(P)H-hydrate epimerase
VCYPKPTDRPLYNGLVTQCRSLGVNFLTLEALQAACSEPQGGVAAGQASGLSRVCDVVVDALFGFSFKGSPRAPFDTLLAVSC